MADCARVSRGCVIGRRLNGDHVLEHEFEAVFGDAAVGNSKFIGLVIQRKLWLLTRYVSHPLHA